MKGAQLGLRSKFSAALGRGNASEATSLMSTAAASVRSDDRLK